MKKTFAILCALALVLSMCLGAFALEAGDITGPETPPPSISPDPEPTVPTSITLPEDSSTDPPTESVPTESVPTESVPTESVPTESVPTESVPTESVPTESAPTESVPTESVPTESVPTESVPTESVPTEPTAPTWTPPTQAPQPTTPPSYGLPKVTKHPSSETVKVGGFAEFVARAENCTTIIWHLQSPGGSTDILAQNAPIRFPGLIVSGLESERLGLDRIPKELNEWRVRAEFVSPSGNVWSEAAVISVTNLELTPPTIQTQPKSMSLKAGEASTLRVEALTSEPNTKLTYQWYKNTINSNVGGKAILGATSDNYTPDLAQGTTYYYCAVRCTNGTDISVATKSVCAAVTYEGVVGATTPSSATAESSATLAPWVTEEVPTTQETLPTVTAAPARSNTLLVIVVAVIVVIAVLGIIATVLILKFYGGRDDYEEPEEPRPARRSRPQPEPQHQPESQRRTEPRWQPDPEPELPNDDEWDDLSDLGDLSLYFGDDDDLKF